MKVAIMGAGLSGLACAIALEKQGIAADVYEARSRVGDRFVTGEIFMSITTRPVTDCVSYMSNELGISLHPVNMIRTIHIFGPTEYAAIEGRLGHSNIRGRRDNTLEMNLAGELRTPIRFESKATYEDLQQEYSHVVLATGDTEYAHKLRNYDTSLTVSMKGALVSGHFDLQSVYTWLNDDFCPKGYGYLIPMSEEEACVAIAYPEYPPFQALDIHKLFDAFMARVRKDMAQELPLLEEQFEINRYVIGISRSPRIGNTFFVGNNFGSVMPFLGFGQFTSIVTGTYAGWDMAGQGDYEALTRPLRKAFHNSLIIRRAMERIGNDELDAIVRWLASPLGNKLFQSNLDVLKAVSYLLRPWIKIKEPAF